MPIVRHAHAPSAGMEPGEIETAAGTLAQRLASPDAVLRRAAAAGAMDGEAETVALLLAALDDEPEPAVRSALLDALGRIASEESVAGLAACLHREDAWLRNAAIEVLRGLPDQVAGALALLLADRDRDVRILAVGILDSLRHEQVEEWLLQLIDVDDDVNVCGVALDVLAQIGGSAARAPVARLLARYPDEPYIAFAGALVLARLED